MWTDWATKGERGKTKRIFNVKGDYDNVYGPTTNNARSAERVFWLLRMLQKQARGSPLVIIREVTAETSVASPPFLSTQRGLLLQSALAADTTAAAANLGQRFASLLYITGVLAELQYSPQATTEFLEHVCQTT